MRLALFSDTYAPQINGVALTLQRLDDAVRSRGGAVQVWTAADPAAAGLTDGVHRHRSVPFWGYPQLRLAWPLRPTVARELASFRPTLIHAATPFGVGLAGRAGARALGVPFVTSYHTSFSAYAAHYGLGALAEPGWRFLRWFHNEGARTYVPTWAVRDELHERGFSRLQLWSRGVDTHRFSPAARSDAVRAALGVGPDDVLAVYVGRLAAEKGLDTALAAFHRLTNGAARSAGPRVVFALAGDGPHGDRFRAAAPPGTTFVGRLSGAPLAAFYASADVFVFPSTTDTFGNVMLEAMASGVPVVGADVPQTRELVGPDRGVLCRPNDPEALAVAIAALGACPEGRAHLGTRARAFATRASWTAVFDGLLADYEAVVEAHHRRSLGRCERRSPGTRAAAGSPA